MQTSPFIIHIVIRFTVHITNCDFKNIFSIDVFGCCVLDHSDGRELLPLSPRALDSSLDPLGHLLPPAPKRTGADYRALWKTAIHQQILLLRMEKENQRLEGELQLLLCT